MKEKDKNPFIVPYVYNLDGNLMGNPVAHLSGLPVYVEDRSEDAMDEDLL